MTDRTDRLAAAEELLKRRSTRRSLAEWGRHKGFEPAKHHQLIINEIEAFLLSDDEVLLLFAPPGSAKSTYVSILLPSWYLANNPTHSILAATHSVEFAERWGRRVRNDIAADENVLGISLSEDSKAAARWSLESGGEYYGVGAGTGISGFRANLGVGDDLFGSREDAYAAFLRARQRETSPMMWAALYQQRSAPEDGDYFKADWLKPCDALPARDTLRIYGGSDYAVTADGGDYTVHIVVGLDPEGRMYLLDLWRKQTASDEWIEAFCDLVTLWKPMGWAEEKGQISAGVGPALDRRQRERQAYTYRQSFPTRGDKAVRAQSIRGRMALEGLYVPTGASWYPTFRSELLSFPAGKHDDQVDALGLIGQLLDQMVPGQRPKVPEKPKPDSGYRPLSLGERPLDWILF